MFRIATFSVFLLPFFCLSLVKSQAAQQNDGVVALFKQTQAEKRNVNLTLMEENLEGRSKGRPPRFPIPSDWTNVNHQKPMECGGTYSVAEKGFVRFTLDSSNSPCYHAFLGSRAQLCSVGVMCDGTVRLSEGNSRGCENNYLKIGDGTIGALEQCGQFQLSNPRIARNQGTDLYVEYKGSSPSSPCVAFCMEDLKKTQLAVPPPQFLTKSSFRGFRSVGRGTTCECGIKNEIGRIVGGSAAYKFEFPWLGGIVYNGHPDFARVPFCDGSLISDSHVITAAHCFSHDSDPTDFQVLLHAHVMDKTPNYGEFTEDEASITPGWSLPKATDQSENSIRVEIAEIVSHPLFNRKTFDYDVAVLTLKTKVNIHSGRASPICLPNVNELFSFQDHETMLVAGWGASAEKAPVTNRLLQKLDVPFVKYQRCLQYIRASKRHLCAGYLEGGKDSCTGDSGGPLIYNFNPNSNQYVLSGVVSAGAGCARRFKLGLYTDVQEVIQWVYHHTAHESVQWCGR